MTVRGQAVVTANAMSGAYAGEFDAVSSPALDGQRQRGEAPNDAVFRAISTRQFTSLEFGRVLDDHQVLQSVGSVGDAFDNALAESLSTRSRPS
jgi:transposase InsO family protein